VLITFFGFSFVSPQYSWLLLPEGINMRDFRAWSFDSIGAIAAPLWLTFWVVGAVAALTHRQYRLVATGMAVALAMHFLIFALGAGLAPWLSVRSLAGKVYAGAVVLLALMIAANNLPIARNFVTDFDAVSLSCAPPCTEQTGQ
jgi:hypothetical protein